MEDKLRFKEGLQRMRRMAAGNAGHVTIQDILSCFPGMELTKEQVGLIYQYAEQEQIFIEDYQLHDTRSVNVGEAGAAEQKAAEPELTGEEKISYKLYLEELENVIPCDPEEEEMLLERLLNGDDMVIGRLTEGNLHMVLEVAKGHVGHGILIGDLVQEGNIALMMALQDLTMGAGDLSGGLQNYLKNQINQALKELLKEQMGYEKAGSHMARETNRLLQATMELEDELGREATLTELAEKIKAEGLHIDCILCSPLIRARETARIIAEETGIELKVENRLNEQCFGIWEGTARNGKEFHEAKTHFIDSYKTGETMLKLAHRIYGLIDEITAQDDKVYLLVAHNGISRVVQSYFHDLSNEEYSAFGIRNCEIVKYEY